MFAGNSRSFLQRRRAVVIVFGFLLSLIFYSTTNKALLSTRINQLSIEVERRMKWWDWQDTQEEIYCRLRHPLEGRDPVPNVVHFVYVSREGERSDLMYAHFLAIKAAVLRMDAAEIKLHTYDLNVQNRWWQEIKDYVTLVVHRHDDYEGPRGLPMRRLKLAHQADVLRIAILKQEGGIYLDLDVYTLRPFTDLLSNQRDTIMAHEGGNRYGICNAVIVSRANSEFLVKWQESYKSFNPNGWNEHSVRMPKLLQVQYPDLICPLSPTAFFWPTWAKTHIRYMHDELTPEELAAHRFFMSAHGGAMYANQLAFHAGGSGPLLRNLTPEYIMTKDTRFNLLVREIAAAPL